MKKFSKILSVALLVALVLSLGVANAFAEDQTPPASIKITHDASYEGATGTTARVYNAYKILDASYDTLSGSNTQAAKDTFNYTEDALVSYTLDKDSPWVGVMTASTQTWLDVVPSTDGDVYIVTPKASFTGAAQAKAFGDYLAANIPDDADATEVTVDAANATPVEKGYYLIVGKDDKDAVTRVAVVTTDVTMVEKNTYITTGKTTSETSYNVGDTVTYTATVFIPSDTALTTKTGDVYDAGHGPVILHDRMDSRLTFDGVSAVTAKIGTDNFTGFTVKTTVSEASDAANKCTFEVEIPVTSDLRSKTITFTYTATVNETAVNDEGFINELGGELNGYKTNPDDVWVYTFDFKFNKKFMEGSTQSADTELSATFEVRTDADDENTAIAFNAAGTKSVTEGQTSTTYTVYKKAMTGGETSITVKNGEHVDLIGLKAGTYYLVETGTSTGYNRLTEPMTVVITEDEDSTPQNPKHTVTYSGNGINATTGEIPLVNNSGSVLPSTGGIGTTIFYVVGGVLVLAAIILLVTKKRMSE